MHKNYKTFTAAHVLWLYGLALFVLYAVFLARYAESLSTLPRVELIASVLLSYVLEIVAFICAEMLLLGRASQVGVFRIILLSALALMFTAGSVVQFCALSISNSFVSVLAMENINEARLSTTSFQIAMIIASVLAACFLVLVSTWANKRRPARFNAAKITFSMIIMLAAVVVLNRDVPIGGGISGLSKWQSPLGSLMRTAYAALKPSSNFDATGVEGRSVCGVNVSTARYPFLKDYINSQNLPFSTEHEVAKPNVIVIFIEGTSSRLLGNYGGHYPGLTPNLSRMADESMVVDNYFNHAAATFRGIQGQMTSGYTFHGGWEKGTGWEDGNASSYAKRSYATLPKVLNAHGYDTIFFSPHKKSEGLYSLAQMLGFENIYYYARSRKELLTDPQPPYKEALTDHDEYRALTNYLKQRDDAKPFMIGLYSLGTHAFLDVPSGGEKYGDGRDISLNTLHNVDAQFGKFYDYFMKSKYSKNTVLVVTADHAHYPGPPYMAVAGSDFKPYFVDRIPLLISAPWLKLPRRFDAHDRTSLDLTPTILQILDINKGWNSFLGFSIFDQSHDQRMSMAALGEDIYAIYKGHVYSSRDVPSAVHSEFVQCKALAETYYAHENDGTIFPAGGAGDLGDLSIDQSADISMEHVPAALVEAAKPIHGCALDTINGAVLPPKKAILLSRNFEFVATGWIVNDKLQAPRKFELILQGDRTYGFDERPDVSRPDVARYLKSEAAMRSGFNVTVNLNKVPVGTYGISALIKGGVGNEVCDTGRHIVIH